MSSIYQEMVDYAVARTRRNLAAVTDFPELAKDGVWHYSPGGGWTGGHWVGLLWLSYAHTGDPALQTAARQWAARLAPRRYDTGTHDLGFLFELSHMIGERITADQSLKQPALTAARALTLRFNEQGKFIRAWGKLEADDRRGRAIIDTLMNLDLLFWATRQTGDPVYGRMASDHAHTALAYQVRPDWSTAHCMDFDPDSGAFLKQDTHQGLSATSCWSRGHAWAVYGYTETYGNTGDPTFLAAARGLADHAVRRLPDDHVPFWDYDSPLIPNDVRDSSAGAILAAGLMKLAEYDQDAAEAQRRRDMAGMILRSLWENYSSRGTPELSILIHATRSKPAGHMESGLIYGDYYFLEALTWLTRPAQVRGWV